MKRRALWMAAGILVLGAVLGGLAWRWEGRASTAAAIRDASGVRWIIDAGHGGEDGGAVSPGGVVESRINLEIARRMDGIFGFCGEPALMLRTEDISLHDPEAVSLREKKASDLHNRAGTASSYPEATLLSIHQNMFQQSRYRGTQVFYAPTQGSQELAQAIQGVVRESLQPDNSRESKPIPDTVYLMNHIPNRAVLVECGFLSNPGEEGLLQDPKYQTKLAAAIAAGCLVGGSASSDGTVPRFAPQVKKPRAEGEELTIFYDFQCPYILQSVELARSYCQETGTPVTFHPVDSLEKAKALPCVFNNWAVFYKRKFETVNLLDLAALKRILKK